MRDIVVWVLVILTLALVGWFWVRPSFVEKAVVKKFEMPPEPDIALPSSSAPEKVVPEVKGVLSEKEMKKAPSVSKVGKGIDIFGVVPSPTEPEVKTVAEAPVLLPPPPPKPSFYEKLKTELKEWGTIMGPFSPFVTIILTFVVKRKKKGKKST